MDPHHDVQDLPRCDLCKTALVQNYCDFCHVNLCKPCIGEHISDDYKKHVIVPFRQRKTTLNYPKCGTHQHEACKYQCKDCNIFLCSHCLASKQHKDHEFLQLDEVFRTKKENIVRDREELERQVLPAYEEIAIYLEEQLSKIDGNYTKLTTRILNQRAELQREIQNAFDEINKNIGETKVKHHSILKKHLDEIKEKQSLIQQSLHALNEMEESNEVSPTIGYLSKNRQFSKQPPKVHVSMPKFIVQRHDRENFCSFFGILIPLSTTVEERNTTDLLDEPMVLNTIKTGHEKLRSASCLNGEQIWTSGETDDIKCFNTKGDLIKTIKTMSGEWPNDIALDSNGALLYSDWKTKTVNKVQKDQTEKIVKLQKWIPLQLFVTFSDDLLLTMFNEDRTQSKVVRYSRYRGKITIQFDEEGQPIYSGNIKIKYICENRNLDICVADSGASAVVVVNQAGKLRFRYNPHPSSTKDKIFKPRGISTDSQGRILTADGNNHCIHILDEDGEFLRYIDNCDLEIPHALYVDKTDVLFVCEYFKGSVKKIKYLE